MPSSITAALVYPLVLDRDEVSDATTEGPAPVIERAVPYSDERTDRGRALPPHVTDLVLGQRWHVAVDDLTRHDQRRTVGRWTGVGLRLRWIEIVRFIGADEAATLGDISGGRYPELYDGLAVLHLEIDHEGTGQVRRFLSRGAQDLHADARTLLQPYGHVRVETADGLMEASELPFLVVAAVDDDAEIAAAATVDLIGRPTTSARTAEVEGWRLAVWPDACAIAASRSADSPFRLSQRETWVTKSVMLDTVLVRLAQHHSLSMLARRAADGAASEDRQARRLHGAALRVRSRVWWPTITSTPYLERLAEMLADQWSLEPLAHAVFADVDGLAQHAELVATERLNRLVFVLTAGALGIALVSLLVQVTTSDEAAVGAVTAGLAAVAALLVALVLRRTRSS